jgi:excisionase family DNA binding protein
LSTPGTRVEGERFELRNINRVSRSQLASGEFMSTNARVTRSPRQPQLLKVPEVASLLNVKPRTIYEMVAQGRIPYRKPPGSNILRFDLEEIVEWTKAGK